MADPRKIIQLATSAPKMLEELSRYGRTSKLAAKIAEPSRTQVLPMPNRWFLQPEKYPKQQPLVERVLQANNMERTDFFSGANVDPKTGKVLDFNVMDDLGVAITNRPSMSGLPSGMESFLEVPESTGPLTRSNLVRRGLFKPVGGDPMLNDLSFLATIERSGAGHQYGLGTEYMSPAELTNTMTGQNPTLRPHSRGDLFGMGDVVGRIQTPQGRPTDVYESLLVAPKGSDVKGVKLHKKKGGAVDQTIAQAKSKQTGQYNPQRVRTPSQFERDFDRQMQAGLIGQNAVKRGVASWVPDTAGLVGDLAVDLPYWAYQRAIGKRGENIKPLDFGGDIRRVVGDAIGANPIPVAGVGMSMPPDETNEAVTEALQLVNPITMAMLANPLGITKKVAGLAASGAKNLAPTAAKLAEDYFMRTGQILPVIKPSGGNWLQGNVENSMKGLRSRGPTEFDREWLIRHADQEPIASQRGLQAIPQNEAINQFVDKQLTGYVKNQMGTAGDPIRLAADAFPEQKAKLLFDKQKQIDKATADMEKARLARGFTPEMMTRSQARIRELEKERELIELRTGLHYEPQGGAVASAKARQQAGFPVDPISTTPYGQAWENISDAAIEGAPYRMSLPMVTPETAPDALRALGGEFAVQNPNAMAYSIKGGDLNDVMTSRNLGFGHIMDELRNATNVESGLPKELLIDPKNLSKWTAQQSVEHVDKINAWRAAQKAEADLVRANNAATVMHKDYPEKGMKWVELRLPENMDLPEGYKVVKYEYPNKPTFFSVTDPKGITQHEGQSSEEAALKAYAASKGHPALESALKYEGEQLQHCVGGYCPDVVSGKSRIFSLRDAKGKPHATIEVGVNKTLPRWDDVTPYLQAAEEEAKKLPKGYTSQDVSDIATKMAMEKIPSRIAQIKGMKNLAPNEDYLPYVQDFVRSGKWSDVGDLHHTGLYKTEHDTAYSHNILPELGENGAYGRARVAGDIQPYMTKVEIEAAMKKHAQDNNILPPSKPMTEADITGPWEPEDMKRGGSVNQDAMQMAVWNKAIRKQVGGDPTQAEIDAATLPARMNPKLAAQGEAYRANMTPPTSVMDPRYPAWKKNQDAADAVGAVGDLALSAIPMAGPALQGVKAAGRFAGPELARGLENYMVKAGGILPMDTWHGSPHRFPPSKNNPLGEFDASKIGTGEGAQAYGAGAYLAESRGVAQSYKDTLGSKTYDGKYYNSNKPEHIAADILEMVGGNKESAIKKLEEDAATMLADGMSRNALASKRAAESIKDGRAAKIDYTGSLYKVDLPDEQIAKMLDWDKPLSQQSKEVKSIADKLGVKARVNVSENPNLGGFQMVYSSGSDIVDAAIAKFGSKEAASEFLRKEGIPGIRYLDQGSRSGGAGTSNFVVFDPKHMNIIGREKNGGLVNQDAMNMAVWDKAVRKGGGGRMNAAEMALKLIKKGAKTLDVSNELKSAAAARTAAGVPDLPPAIKTGVKAGLTKPQSILASKALDQFIGEKLALTPSVADRMVARPGRSREKGGPMFPWLSTVDPEYEGWVWANKGKGKSTQMIRMAEENPGLIFTPQFGDAEMHRSNQVTFERLLRAFNRAKEEGKLTPELEDAYNKRLTSFYKDVVSGKPLFSPEFSIGDLKPSEAESMSFPARAAIAEVLGGKGLRDYGYKRQEAAQIIPYKRILENMTEPSLIDAPSGSVGPRLFTLSGERVTDPSIHAAYPEIVGGKDLGVQYEVAPRDIIAHEFVKKIQESKGRPPGHMDWDRNSVIMPIDMEMILRLQDAGKKKGGRVQKKAAGGLTSDDLVLEERKL